MSVKDADALSDQQARAIQQLYTKIENQLPWSIATSYIDHQRSLAFFQENLEWMYHLAAVDRPPPMGKPQSIGMLLRIGAKVLILSPLSYCLRFWLKRQATLNELLVAAAARTVALEKRVLELEKQLREAEGR